MALTQTRKCKYSLEKVHGAKFSVQGRNSALGTHILHGSAQQAAKRRSAEGYMTWKNTQAAGHLTNMNMPLAVRSTQQALPLCGPIGGAGHNVRGGGGRQQHLEDIGVGQLLSACSHAVQHEGQVLMVLLPDDMKDAILLREARRDKVINVCKLSYKAVGIVEDLVGALVSVLAGSHELGAALQQGRSDVLDAHPDLLLHALPVPLHGHSSCRAQVRQQLAMKQSQV